MRDYFRFALDSVLVNRRRSLLTVAIIAVGVASLVGIQTALAILSDEVAGSLGRAGAGLFTVQAKDDAPPIGFRQAAAFCDGLPGAASVWAEHATRVQVRSGGVTTDPVVRVLACDAHYLSCQDVRLAAGRGFTLKEVETRQPVAILGDNLRRKLFGGNGGPGEMVSFEGGRYRVVGVLARQGALYGSGLDASLLVPVDASAASCRVTVRAPSGMSASAAVAEAGRQMAAIRRLPPGAEPDFEIVQAEGAEATLAALRAKLSLVALGIGLITMLGASVGLMNSLLVSVKERTREIGTRRALGARARTVARDFLMESVVIGQLGGLSGVLLGLAFGGLTALVMDGRFTVPWQWVGAALAIAFVVSLLSGLLPARRAAALDPIEALRSL